MGWFRGRRKRRAAGSAAESAAESSANAAGPAATAATVTAADARQASTAGSPDARAAFEPEPAAAARTPVSDPVPWRRLEDGAYERLLGPLETDADVSALLDHCEGSAPWDTAAARRLIDRTANAGPALNRLLGRETPARAQSAEFINGLIKALALLPAEEAVPLLVRLASQQCGLTATSMPTARAAIRALATVPGELVPPALHRLAAEARLAALRRAAYAELKRRLSTLSDAPEWTVSTFGLDPASRIRVPVGPGHVAVVRVETGGRVGVRYFERTGPEAAEGRPLSRQTDGRDGRAGRAGRRLGTGLRTADGGERRPHAPGVGRRRSAAKSPSGTGWSTTSRIR